MRLTFVIIIILVILAGCRMDNPKNTSQKKNSSSKVVPVTVQILNEQKGEKTRFQLLILSNGKENKNYASFPVNKQVVTNKKGKVVVKLQPGIKYHFSVFYAEKGASIKNKKSSTSDKKQKPLLKKTIIGPKAPTNIKLIVNNRRVDYP